MPPETLRIEGRVVDPAGRKSTVRLRVEAWAKSKAARRALASTITQAGGRFRFELDPAHLRRSFGRKRPELVFKVYARNRLLPLAVETAQWHAAAPQRPVAIALQSPSGFPAGVIMSKPGPAIPVLLQAAAIPTKTLAPALAKSGVKNLRDLFRGGPDLTAALTPLATADRQKLMLVAKLGATTDNLALASRLAATGIRSLSELAVTPLTRLEDTLGTLTAAERSALQQLQRNAGSVRRQTLNLMLGYRRSLSLDGAWYPGVIGQGVVNDPGKYGKADLCFECSCCDNVFSPRAYLYDLLDLIFSTWSLAVDTLEQLFLQPIVSLDCDAAMRPLPQVCLTCQLLEKYLGNKIPITDANWARKFRAVFAQMFGDELVPPSRRGGFGRTPVNIPLGGLRGPATTPLSAAPLTVALAALVNTASPTAATAEAIYALLKQDRNQLSSDIDRQALDYFGQRLDDAQVGELFAGYRQRLIGLTGQDGETLEQNLFVDLESGGCHLSTRIEQLILAAQTFILAARTGDIGNVQRPDLASTILDFSTFVAEPVEENAWQWLGNYATWLSAMYTFVYTENVIPPPLGNDRTTQQYDDAVQLLQGGGAPATVRQAYFDFIFPGSLPDFLNYLQQQNAPGDFYIESILGTEPWDLADWVSSVKQVQSRLSVWWADYGVGFVAAQNATASGSPSTTGGNPPNSGSDGAGSPVPPYADAELQLEQNLYFPLLAGWALNQSGNYAAAHDWYRQLYDPEKPADQRYGIDAFSYWGSATLQQSLYPENWLANPIDPTVIALGRPGVYLRHTILRMVRNLLDWADHEFTLATPESLDRARELYQQARRVLQAPELGGKCGQAISQLIAEFVASYTMVYQTQGPVPVAEIEKLRGIRHWSILQETIGGVRTILSSAATPDDKLRRIADVIRQGIVQDRAGPAEPGVGADWQSRRQAPEAFENALFFTGGAGLTGFGAGPGGDPPDGVDGFAGGQPFPNLNPSDTWGRTNPNDPNGPAVPGTGSNGPGTGNGTFVAEPVYSSVTFCVPANPLLKSMDLQIEVDLWKLANCLSITGAPLPPDTFTCGTTDRYAGILGGQFNSSSAPVAPDQSNYRYSYLVEKARQYIDVAQKFEAAFLLAREKADDEVLHRLQARQAIETTQASITLKQLGVREAIDSSAVTDLQQQKASSQLTFWNNRMNQGMMSDMEKLGLGLMLVSGGLQAGAAALELAGALPAAAVGGVGLVAAGAGIVGGAASAVETLGVGAAVGGGIALFGLGAAAAAGPLLSGALSSAAGAASTFGSAALTYASFQRRWEDWSLQRDLALWDQQIAGAQIVVAHDQVGIASQELQIAQLDQTHAQQILSFYLNKFTNLELYQWMIEVLQRSYRQSMQIATDVARLAQTALEFERQADINFITGDYWSLDSSGTPTTGLSDLQKQSGLLGAERLLADLDKLDAYKIETDKRRLQISKTISLAQMLPYELIELRQNGTVTFNTLMSWFDADFPGHYLRLIKTVRVTVLALVPPNDGIRAMLTNTGESSVVVPEQDPISGDQTFVKQRSARKFGEEIALHSGYNETGLFVLNYDDPMLLPFEALGVETQWTFSLPRATNRLNFDTIADVLFTIEYTAVNDAGYAEQVKAQLGTVATSDIAVPLSALFPDQWYTLKNPPPNATGPQTTTLTLPRQLFPSNLKYDPANGATFETTDVKLVVTGRFGDLLHSQQAYQQGLPGSLAGAITVAKGSALSLKAGSGSPTYRIEDLKETYLFLSTQSSPASSGTSPTPPTEGLPVAARPDPVGEWTITLDSSIYTTLDAQVQPGQPAPQPPQPLINRVQDLFLVLTVKGSINW